MIGNLKKFKGTLIILIIVLFLITGLGIILYWHKDISTGNPYVTSEKCKDCHLEHYESWQKNTLHPWQFRPIDKPVNLIFDLIASGAGRTFAENEVEFVVGNKWEKIYLRKIDGEYYPFTAKWLVKEKKWIPFKVKDWKDTAMSFKCNGCHTTGFNPDTLTFAEFGIGCEACHGPGSRHLKNRTIEQKSECKICHRKKRDNEKDIVSSVGMNVCGQCHNRGSNIKTDKHKAGKFAFPINYVPGDDNGELDRFFDPLTSSKDKKGEFWWENGIAKNRHQELFEFKFTKHAGALNLMKEKHSKDRGVIGDECLKCHSADYRLSSADKKPTVETARHGVTCVVCHEPHGFDKKNPAIKDGTLQCGGCHIDSMSFKTAEKGKRHYPCPISKVTCPDCHMPYTVLTAERYAIRSHAFKIITPMETRSIGIPSSCQNGGCHIDKSINWAITEFTRYYPDFEKK